MDGGKIALRLDTLAFPKHLAGVIGYCAWSIGMMKKAGCRFCGRKTTIRWVRQFLTSHPDFKTSSLVARRQNIDLRQPCTARDRQVSASDKSDEPRELNAQ